MIQNLINDIITRTEKWICLSDSSVLVQEVTGFNPRKFTEVSNDWVLVIPWRLGEWNCGNRTSPNSRHKTPLQQQSIVGGRSEVEQNNKILSTFKVKDKGGFRLDLAASKVWLFMFSHGTPADSIVGVFLSVCFIQQYLINFVLATYVSYFIYYFQ